MDLKKSQELGTLDTMIEQITVDAYGDDEQFRAFLQAFEDYIVLPADAFVIGEPVSVIAIEYDGNERRGLTAKFRREDGFEYVLAASDMVLPQASSGAQYIAAYRRWLKLDPYPSETQKPRRRRAQHNAAAGDIDLSKPVELVALAVKDRAARCRLLESGRVITLRAGHLWELVPGAIVTVIPKKQWRYAGHPYLSGEIQSTRIDAKALDLEPLKLADRGMWEPKEKYWGEEELIEEWVRPIIAYGPRPMFELEQVLPGETPDDPFNDPITRAIDLNNGDEQEQAIMILMALCQADLRCLDAHSHLGNFVFDHRPQVAIQHYEVGLRIGELTLGDDFTGVLPWGFIDNRPFLRCMHGYGLSLWHLGRFDEVEHIFQKMLWLNPSDNQGIRFLIEEVKVKTAWEDREAE